MRLIMTFLGACLLAALAPLTPTLVDAVNGERPETAAFPGWPTTFEGRPLARRPLAANEERFVSRRFPGRIARFSDGRREIILRWVTRPTRQLHRATVCFKGYGHTVTHLPARCDAAGNTWCAFRAEKDGRAFDVRSRVFDEHGNSWPDVSAWFWAATCGKTEGPWWAVTVAEVAER
ncbi:MAG: hypothetical protein JXR37_13675 [Kiritimatiellae bacterium]|nr:hypothetical protein [Kiritimatiellia bacterium]